MSAARCLPERYLPGARELSGLVRARPGASLRQIARAVWPALPWAPACPGGDSATARPRTWQAPLGPGTVGNRAVHATAAEWLRDRMEELVQAGVLRHGPRRRDEVDLLASLSYWPAATAEAHAVATAGAAG